MVGERRAAAAAGGPATTKMAGRRHYFAPLYPGATLHEVSILTANACAMSFSSPLGLTR